MIQKLVFSIILIAAMYYVGRMSSFLLWNQRRPIIAASAAGSIAAASSVRIPNSLDIPMAPENAVYRVGDRIDVLAKNAQDWNIVAMDAVVTMQTPRYIRLTVKKEHWMTVQDARLNSLSLKLQRTISLSEPSVAVPFTSKLFSK